MPRFSSRVCFLTVLLLMVHLAAGQEEVLKVFSVCLMFASDVPNLSFAAVDTVVRPFVCLCQTRRAVR